MAEFAAIPLFTDSWMADTAHLGRAERGLYMDLLILIWRSPDCRVPNDLAWIARRLRVADDEAEMLASVVKEFCQSTGNWLTQKRLKREWNYTRAKVERMSVLAKSRWNKKKEECLGNAENHDLRNAPTPTPTPTYSVDKSTGADAPIDPEKVMFDGGVRVLVAAGKTEAQARTMLGKWKRDYTTPEVIAAIAAAQRHGAIDPVSYIAKALGEERSRSKSDNPRQGDLRTLPDGRKQVFLAGTGWATDHG